MVEGAARSRVTDVSAVCSAVPISISASPRHGGWIITSYAIDAVSSKTRQAISRHLQVFFPSDNTLSAKRVLRQILSTSLRSSGLCRFLVILGFIRNAFWPC